MNEPAFPYDVFLSHSAKDKAVVRPLAERLRKDGLKVWFDEWVLKAGDSIPPKIEEGLLQFDTRNSAFGLPRLCMSANASGSDWAQLEAGTLMVEPAGSEPKVELDHFCNAMIAIHAEIQAVGSGKADAKNNVLKNVPHPADMVCADKWDRPSSREQAAYPVPSLRDFKFWPAVSRVDNVFGDRNLVCSCVGMENCRA
ncbi:MAG: TIR domain-containing protein [Pedosphaera sp.]|nr:TIR domain-containing protein [Pedosphaera sp.]